MKFVRRASLAVVCLTMLGGVALRGEEKAGQYSYVGSNKCKKCHIKQYKSWEKTKMAQSIEALKPNARTDRKAEAEPPLDPAKDYTTDPECLRCHTVGFGEAGGFALAEGKLPDEKTLEALGRVGCESCHGPGSEYIKVFEEIQKSKRKYKAEELHAIGLREMGPDACTSCHSKDSPFVAEDFVFDYEEQKDKDTHEHLPLKQREG